MLTGALCQKLTWQWCHQDSTGHLEFPATLHPWPAERLQELRQLQMVNVYVLVISWHWDVYGFSRKSIYTSVPWDKWYILSVCAPGIYVCIWASWSVVVPRCSSAAMSSTGRFCLLQRMSSIPFSSQHRQDGVSWHFQYRETRRTSWNVVAWLPLLPRKLPQQRHCRQSFDIRPISPAAVLWNRVVGVVSQTGCSIS